MIILAAAIILSLSSNGLIDRANEAVKKTDKAQVQILANTIWMEAYLDGARTDKELYDAVREGLKKNNINPELYAMDITSNGVGEVEEAIWVQEGTIAKNAKTGKQISVADYVNYTVDGYTGTWQVLGAENGELLIVSSTDVDTVTLGAEGVLGGEGETNNDANFKKAQQDYITGVYQLDKACEPFGNGAKASGVRSITSEDIYRIVNYEKTRCTGLEYYKIMMKMLGQEVGELTDAEIAELQSQFGMMDYGKEVTFYWNGSDYPSYKYDGMTESVNLESLNDVFVWYDGASKSWKKAENPGDTISVDTPIVADDGSGVVAKITNNVSGLYGTDKLEEGSPIYNMLIGNDEGKYTYWLASPIAYAGPGCGSFGFGVVDRGGVIGGDVVFSYGLSYANPVGVRAVVSLESDIVLQETVEGSGEWNITKAE